MVVGWLYGFFRENGAILGASVGGSVSYDWLVGLVQDILAMKGEFIKAFHKHR